MTHVSAAGADLDPAGPSTSDRGQSAVDVETFFNVSLDLLVIRDLEGMVVKASPSWTTCLGHTPEEMEGRPLLRFVHPDDMPATLDTVDEVMGRKPSDPVLGFINRYRHKDGGYRTLEWRAQRFGDRIYGVARDVTDRVSAELELIKAKAGAEAASRAKSDFLANMSHEIRTPLSGIIGVIDALSRTPLSAEQAEMVGLAQDSGLTLERLVSDFLDVSKIEAGQLQLDTRPFDMDRTLRPCVELMRLRAIEKGLTFDVISEGDARGLFLGDGTRLGQIVGNLLSNAVKFTQTGGVTLRIAVSEEAGSARLTFTVEDTGIGFDADQAKRLFNRFSQADETTSRRFGGTGLGLSICRSLAEMMGGAIVATSTPGVGSRFVAAISMPRAEALDVYGSRDAETPVALGSLLGRPLRILLAEDHPINKRVIELILDGQGVELLAVTDGAQAVAAFADDGFDLVLMDMQMPCMDGLAATAAIRALEAERAAARTPVVMLSANAMAQHRDDAFAAGADLHLAKPITAASLLAGIQAVVNKGR